MNEIIYKIYDEKLTTNFHFIHSETSSSVIQLKFQIFMLLFLIIFTVFDKVFFLNLCSFAVIYYYIIMN